MENPMGIRTDGTRTQGAPVAGEVSNHRAINNNPRFCKECCSIRNTFQKIDYCAMTLRSIWEFIWGSVHHNVDNYATMTAQVRLGVIIFK